MSKKAEYVKRSSGQTKTQKTDLDKLSKDFLTKKLKRPERQASVSKKYRAYNEKIKSLISTPAGIPSNYFLVMLEGSNKVSFVYKEVNPILEFLGYNQAESSELLETNPSTISRWKNAKKQVDIGKLRSKVFLELDEIIAKGIQIFGSEELFQEWLNTTNYALGDVKPVDMLKDVYSMELVEEALDALTWGDYL